MIVPFCFSPTKPIHQFSEGEERIYKNAIRDHICINPALSHSIHIEPTCPPQFHSPLIQKPLRHLRPPNRQTLIPRRSPRNRRILIDQIPIGIMLHHIPRSIPPIIKDLTTQYMSSDSPYALIPLTGKPFVPQVLGVEIMHFETTVVNVRGWVRGHEECVVVCVAGSEVYVEEYGDVGALGWLSRVGGYVEEVCRGEVEGGDVPFQECGKVFDAETVVAQL